MCVMSQVIPVNLLFFKLHVGHRDELIQLELGLEDLSLAWRVRPAFLLPPVDSGIGGVRESSC